MTKNRLKDLQKSTTWSHVSYQRVSQQAEIHDVENPVDDDGNHSTAIDMENEHDVIDILTEIDLLRSQIDKIDELVEEVKRLQLDMLEPVIDSNLEQKLDDKRGEIKTISYKVSTKLKQMEQIQENESNIDKTTAKWRIRESQICVITRRFRDTMDAYNQEFVVHRDRCKMLIKRGLEITGTKHSDDEVEEMLENGFPMTLTRSVMVDTQKAKEELRGLEQRQRDLAKIEASIKELHYMFVDVALLIERQGEMINNIEQNVLQTGKFSKDANDAVKIKTHDANASKTGNFAEETTRYLGIAILKKYILKNKIILGVILTTAVVILILIFSVFVTQAKII